MPLTICAFFLLPFARGRQGLFWPRWAKGSCGCRKLPDRCPNLSEMKEGQSGLGVSAASEHPSSRHTAFPGHTAHPAGPAPAGHRSSALVPEPRTRCNTHGPSPGQQHSHPGAQGSFSFQSSPLLLFAITLTDWFRVCRSRLLQQPDRAPQPRSAAALGQAGLRSEFIILRSVLYSCTVAHNLRSLPLFLFFNNTINMLQKAVKH